MNLGIGGRRFWQYPGKYTDMARAEGHGTPPEKGILKAYPCTPDQIINVVVYADGPVQFDNSAGLIMILQIGAHAGAVMNHINAVRLQVICWSDA